MLDILLPKKINYLLDLIRFKKPIGFTLLMWPCFFGLASLSNNQLDILHWYILFFIGAFTMRSAGCIINDIVDINIDKNVKRTLDRPLASKKITITESLIFLFILFFLSLLILIQFKTDSIILGLVVLPLIFIYPLMKRFTYWPQLFLGIVFNWGVLIVSMQFNNSLNISFIILYVGCIFWTLAYDTIYAYQDREDDITNNIKSTAVLFNDKGKIFVKIFLTFFLISIGYMGFLSSHSIMSIIIIIFLYIGIIFLIDKWDIRSIISSNYFFKMNNLIGLVCYIYLLLF